MNNSDLVEEIIEQICQKADDKGVKFLTESEKIIYFITNLDSEVSINGLIGYYNNSSGDYALETVLALNKIGCEKSAMLLEQANSLFSNNQPLKNRNERFGQMKLLSTKSAETIQQMGILFLDYSDDLSEKLTEFILKIEN